jgi:hypothetical protein
MMVTLYHRIYLNRYRQQIPDTQNELLRWDSVIAAARLSENIIPEREALIRIVQQGAKEPITSP